MMAYNRVVLIVCISQVMLQVFATSGVQDNKLPRDSTPFGGDQSGTVNLPESTLNTQTTYVEFPIPYDSMYVPIVFAEVVSTGLTGNYLAMVTRLTNSYGWPGFSLTVDRYDTTDSVSEALTVRWESTVQKNDQSGTVYLSKSSSSSQTVYIDLPTPYDIKSIPVAFAWVDATGLSGHYRTKDMSYYVNSYGYRPGFEVTVERYDTTDAGSEALTIQWESKLYKNANKKQVGDWYVEGEPKSVDVYLPGYSEYSYPTVVAWTRGSARFPDTFATTVTASSSGFTADIVRNDPNKDTDIWRQDPTLYWSEKDKSNQPGWVTTRFGSSETNMDVSIPPSIWVYTPALTRISDHVYDVLGQVVHISTVLEMLANEDDTHMKDKTEDPNLKLEVTIRADIVYMDGNGLTVFGLKKFTIFTRKLVANPGPFYLFAPVVCEYIDDNGCHKMLNKAADNHEGVNGKDGGDSPTTSIYASEVVGNFEFLFEASDGNYGQEGGDGTNGQDNTWEQPALTTEETCDQYCGETHEDALYKGLDGPNGGSGYDGKRGGNGGDGGNVNEFTMKFNKHEGWLQIQQIPGFGYSGGAHGYGGRPGSGGTAGCGRRCYPKPFGGCHSEVDCYQSGDPGEDGDPGSDGFSIYPVPKYGKDGSVGNVTYDVVDSLREEFSDQIDLLRLIKRNAESLFQRNENSQAEEIFTFLLSVTQPNTTLYDEISESLRIIESGFDYYGNDDNYAPDLDWSYLSKRTDDLLQVGRSFEDAYNAVSEDIDDIMKTAEAISTIAQISISAENSELEYKKSELESEKDLYYQSLRELELTMENEMHQLNYLLPLAIEEEANQRARGMTGLIGGIVGCVEGLYFKDKQTAFEGAMEVLGAFGTIITGGKDSCEAPAIEEASEFLEEKLEFGYEYELIEPEDLDFSTFDVSMVPQIMLSDLAKNKAEIINELRCLYKMDDSETVDQLDMVLDNYFRDGALRISLIDKLMNIDVQLKEISFNLDLLKETENAFIAMEQSAQDSLPMEVKTSYTDLLLNLYQQQENSIMRSLYELSKAYQFSCLWDFHALDKYNLYFSNEVMISNLGSLQGIVQLEYLKQALEDERDLFLNKIASSAGPTSHVYTLLNEFNNITSPDVIHDLQTKGRFTIRINLNANDSLVTGCENCFNQRLDAFYIEVVGDKQNSTIPSTLFVKVAHMGDSYFLVPTNTGGKEVVLLQQSPENIDGGHIMTFDSENLVTSPSQLKGKFLKQEHLFCENSDDFFTQKPCKSPYSTFVITVPRKSDYECTLNPFEMISGTNCKDLDFSKFTSVRVYSKINAWSDYPPRPELEGFELSSLLENVSSMRQNGRVENFKKN